jgi:predicted PurR-regulated permease PerM
MAGTKTVKIELSFASILLVIATLLGVGLIYVLRDILLLVFLAFIMASALGPLLRSLQRHRIPQALSLAGTFLILVGTLIGVGFLIIPQLVHQLELLFGNLPYLTGRAIEIVAGSNFNTGQIEASTRYVEDFLAGRIASLSSSALQVGLGVVSGLISAVTLLALSFYMVVERPKIFEAIALFLPHRNYLRVRKVFERIEEKLGMWLRGQLLLGVIVGTASAIGLQVLGLPFVLPLAIIAGVCELIPIVGPIIAAVPAVIIALTINPTLAIGVIILYVVVQQLESQLIVPKVMERAVGLNPLLIILSLLAGGALLGTFGAIIAVPVAVVITTILEDVRAHEDIEDSEQDVAPAVPAKG